MEIIIVLITMDMVTTIINMRMMDISMDLKSTSMNIKSTSTSMAKIVMDTNTIKKNIFIHLKNINTITIMSMEIVKEGMIINIMISTAQNQIKKIKKIQKKNSKVKLFYVNLTTVNKKKNAWWMNAKDCPVMNQVSLVSTIKEINVLTLNALNYLNNNSTMKIIVKEVKLISVKY